MDLPSDYVEYLENGGAIEAFVTPASAPGYMVLWPVEEIEEMNADYEFATYAPGFLGFGTNGGGEILAFDAKGAVYMLPAIGLEPKYATLLAATWKEFELMIEGPT
jgi:hypothetical protein